MRDAFRGIAIIGMGLLWPVTSFAVDTGDKKPELTLVAISGTWGANNDCELEEGLMGIETTYKDSFSKRKPFPALVIYEEVCEIKSVQASEAALTLSTICKDATEPPQKRTFKVVFINSSHIKLNGKPYKRCPK